MAVSPENLSAALTVLGPADEADSPEQVWAQSSRFFPSHWTSRWPESLLLPPVLDSTEKVLSVSRQALFDLGESIESEADAVNFYVAVCAWGAGTSAQQTHRSILPLREPGAPERLLDGLTSATAGSADDGYFTFNNYSQARIKYLGPAFFTKLLYFAAGRPTPADTRHPLILDTRVAVALGWTKTFGWRTSDYSHYLDLVEQLHERWRPDLPTDVIEYTLFHAGRTSNAPSI